MASERSAMALSYSAFLRWAKPRPKKPVSRVGSWRMQALNHEIAKSKSFSSSACRPFSKQAAAFWRGPLNQSSNQAMDCPQIVESRMQRGLPVHRCYYIAAGLARKILWKLTQPRGSIQRLGTLLG